MTRVAIAGTGFGMYGLMPAFSGIEGCEVVAICGERSERLEQYCKRAGVGNIYADYRKMLDTEKPDAVTIAVPPAFQYGIAGHALKNGMAVLAEKPLALTVSDAEKLYALAQEKKLPNMVDFLFPEIPEWAAAKKALDGGAIGKVTEMRVDWRFLSYDLKNGIRSWKTDPAQGGGALSFYFPHAFYYMEHFLGRISEMQSALSTSGKSLNGGETGIGLELLFENGCRGKAAMDISYEGQRRHAIEFSGEEGTLLLQNDTDDFVDGFELTLRKGSKEERIMPEAAGATATEGKDGGDDPRVKIVRSIAQRFVRWCADGTPSRPDFRDGLRVQQLIETARESAARGSVALSGS